MRRLISWQLIVRDRLHAPKSVEQDYLAGLVGRRNLLGVIQGSGPRGKIPAVALQINDIPPSLFTRDNVHRAACMDQHTTILLRLGRVVALPKFDPVFRAVMSALRQADLW